MSRAFIPTAIEIADARIALLHTIGHLQALAIFAATDMQRDTAMQLANRLLTTVLPLVDGAAIQRDEVHATEA